MFYGERKDGTNAKRIKWWDGSHLIASNDEDMCMQGDDTKVLVAWRRFSELL